MLSPSSRNITSFFKKINSVQGVLEYPASDEMLDASEGEMDILSMADRTVGTNPKRHISDINLRVIVPYG